MALKRFEMPIQFETGSSPAIRMRGITKAFHSAAGETLALKGIDVDIHQGEFVSVVGRSGSGKSTLVNMITGIDRPTSGTVEVGSQPILHMRESRMAVWRGKNLGIVFQFFQLLPMLTLLENVMLPMDFCNMYPPASREGRARELLGRVGLEGLADMLPGAVAGGQQQCAAVARALANDPPILIADEPTGNLDSYTAEQVMLIFEELAARKKTVLIVTHDRGLARRTSRRLLISDGELVNEALSSIFPDADHARLLSLSKRATSWDLPPEAPVPEKGGENGPLYLVTDGELLSELEREITTLPAGSLSDPDSLHPGLRAGGKGARLLELPRHEMLGFLIDYGQQVSGATSGGDAERLDPQWFQRMRGG